MTATEHAEAILKAAGSSLRHYTMPATRAAILAAVEAAMQDARVEERTPPSDDLRAAMKALRAGGNPTNNTIDDAYIGRMFDNCNAVLAAWDAQQGERS